MNKIARKIYEANKNGIKIKANIRLKKNGRFSSVVGTIESLKVSRDGIAYATIRKDNKCYQNVRINNVLNIKKQ